MLLMAGSNYLNYRPVTLSFHPEPPWSDSTVVITVGRDALDAMLSKTVLLSPALSGFS